MSVVMVGNQKYLTMANNSVVLDNATKAIKNVSVDEKARVALTQNVVYLRLDGDFNLNKDLARFYYSLDNKTWTAIGGEYKMIFDYRRMFMGSKFAIFNYATKSLGGYVDVDFFKYKIVQ